jgi:spore germination protein
MENNKTVPRGTKLRKVPLTYSLRNNLNLIKERLKDCPDVIERSLPLKGGSEGHIFFIKGMVDYNLLQGDFIKPITLMDFNTSIDKKWFEALPVSNIAFYEDVDLVVQQILNGNVLFLCDGINFAVGTGLDGYTKRAIEEPQTEKILKGAHDGFIEDLSTNMAILRRKIKNSNLKFKMIKLGAATNQLIAIAYIEDIANEELLATLYEKVRTINIDGLMAMGYIEQSITDFPNSPFPQYLSTERPDKAVSSLLEGKFVILLEGTPVSTIVPVTFFSFFQSTDDYSYGWIAGTFLRLLRYIGMLVAIFLPAIYIAVTTFHYYMAPIDLLITLGESRARVPFHPYIETLLLEITIELIREAAVRLPTYVGTTIGVVGGLVIGQAAVEAGIVSNVLIIIVAVTAVASYVIPVEAMGLAIRIIRFSISLAAATFGIIGIVVGAALLVAHQLTLESLGQPYYQPVIPFKVEGLKDTFARLPIKLHKKRPEVAKPKDSKRGKDNE